MEDADRAAARRRNILTVQPILRALRSNSLGKWIIAGNKQHQAAQYREQLTNLLGCLASREVPRRLPQSQLQPGCTILVVIGTERGLCGRFNAVVAEASAEYQNSLKAGSLVKVTALGTRLVRLMRAQRRELASQVAFPPTALPPIEQSADLVTDWLARFERYEVDAVDVIHCERRPGGAYVPLVKRLIPFTPRLPQVQERAWPPYIIETDPEVLWALILRQLAVVSFNDMLLCSAVAEHSARAALMDTATQNAEKALDELSQAIQLARQQAITNEMQELAAGAGLLRRL